jgi:signal transduction histidine kinase
VNLNTDRVQALAEAAGALSGELDLDTVLQTIVRVAARVTRARYAALGVLGEDGMIERFVTEGADEETIRAIGHYPTGKGLLGVLVRDPRIIRLDNLAAHPASAGFPPNHPPMSNFLGAPVRSGGKVYGNLYLTEKDGGFDAIDEQLVLVLGAQAGSAIENALLSDRLRSLAVQDERDRISRELHDGVIQTLFSIGMGLESARSLVHTDPVRVDARLDMAVDALDGAIRELRNYIFHLRPHQAASLGLVRGLAELAREHEVNALVRPELDVETALDRKIPATMVPDLLQVVREALSNAAKHAGSAPVRVAARIVEHAVQLEIRDLGTGFDASSPKVGRGLENMRERADALDGHFELESAAGQGTYVRLTVPIPEGHL